MKSLRIALLSTLILPSLAFAQATPVAPAPEPMEQPAAVAPPVGDPTPAAAAPVHHSAVHHTAKKHTVKKHTVHKSTTHHAATTHHKATTHAAAAPVTPAATSMETGSTIHSTNGEAVQTPGVAPMPAASAPPGAAQ